MNGLLSFERLREQMRSFLVPFAQQGKVVTREDVVKFFDKTKGPLDEERFP
jgi:hypothetical protein